MRASVAIPCSFLLFTATYLAAAERSIENWAAWRGPRGDGTSLETNIPVKWSATDNVRWKTPLPGRGYSSPIIWGDRIFVTWCDETDLTRVLACLDRSNGKILWQQNVLKAPLEQKHGENSYSSATPATDGKHVWVSFMKYPEMVVACYDFDGNEVWRQSPGKLLSRHGFCSSPILYKDLVILNGDQDAQGYLVAYEKDTGKERWRIDRPNKTRSYCTPVIVEAAGKTQLVMSGSKCVASYDPANGKQHWILNGPTEQYVASLVLGEDRLFLTTGFPEYHLMAIRPDGTGNITDSKSVAWHHAKLEPKEASYVPSPVANAGHFFVVSDQGFASCYSAIEGKRMWMEKLGRHHHASIVVAEDRLYIPADEGVVFVVKAGAKFEVIAKNDMHEQCFASPAIAQGNLFIRTVKHLYCIGAETTGQK